MHAIRFSTLAVAATLAASLAFAQGTGTGTGTGASGGATGSAATANNGAANSNSNAGARQSELARADRDFIEKAAHAGHAEVKSAQVALQKASSAEIKRFAQHMVEDHTSANNELATLARSKGVTPPDGPSLMDEAKLKMLNTSDGAEFDRKYAESMGVQAHRETVALFEKASNEVRDPELKAFATRTLPKLRDHLRMAEQLPQARK